MSSQDMNALLHAMRVQIAELISQLAEIQANPPVATPSVEKKFNKKVEVVADPGAFEGDRARFAEWWIKQKNNQGRQARQLETKKPDDRLNSLAGRSYDEIRAFFYDQQVNEMKAQGKEFGA
ncbi:hypothetical protein SERLA73DRAFT_78619 [Serpula lacrymans var. lacrymans S7.3]|uniref:Uncharacterized protein n=1 Tax=Serpula lacrymans var. lacrymans (strain S7.3) TaxID=936435 RepID=F8QDT4_SERL3|nr:hypothetical protein SERLA73DRAFT_78619 [Serpula lacrymans var. lacrymans S7.3]